MYKVIELEDGLKVIELSKLKHENSRYLFVASLDEEPEYVFLRLSEDNETVTKINDEVLIRELAEKVRLELIEKINSQLAKNKK